MAKTQQTKVNCEACDRKRAVNGDGLCKGCARMSKQSRPASLSSSKRPSKGTQRFVTSDDPLRLKKGDILEVVDSKRDPRNGNYDRLFYCTVRKISAKPKRGQFLYLEG